MSTILFVDNFVCLSTLFVCRHFDIDLYLSCLLAKKIHMSINTVLSLSPMASSVLPVD